MAGQTLLLVLAHPDDEVGAAAAILAQRRRGGRVVIVWLTRGEMTEAFGPLPPQEVARRREAQGHGAGEILGAETRFLHYPDTRLVATPEAAQEVARIIAEVRPDALLTWGEGWLRGIRHPDHQACGRIARDAVTLARIAKAVAPLPPHRAPVPVFTFRDAHSTLPTVVLDAEPYRDTIQALAAHYRAGLGFGDPEWIDQRLRNAAEPYGLRYAEVFDAWETRAGHVPALLPAELAGPPPHPERPPLPDPLDDA